MKWLKNKLGQVAISRAVANAQEEALYQQAALEVAHGDIRPGLWAKATAAADGDERKAQARYLGLRVKQMQLQCSAAEEMARIHSPADAERLGLEETYDPIAAQAVRAKEAAQKQAEFDAEQERLREKAERNRESAAQYPAFVRLARRLLASGMSQDVVEYQMEIRGLTRDLAVRAARDARNGGVSDRADR